MATSTSTAQTPLRGSRTITTSAGVSSSSGGGGSSSGGVKRVRRTPSANTAGKPTVSSRTTTTTTTTTSRRAPPKAKLNLNFSAMKPAVTISSSSSSSARKPLRVAPKSNSTTATNAETMATKPVDVSKILRGVYAMVDVRVGADAEIDCSDAVAKKLMEMGATIMKKKGGRLTHVVVSHYTAQWKDKVTKWNSVLTPVEVVSQLWVNACLHNKQRMQEKAYFPVNKGGGGTGTGTAMAATKALARSGSTTGTGTTAATATATTAVALRVSRTSARATMTPARSTGSAALSTVATPVAFQSGSLVTSTPTPTSTRTPTPRATAARKRRALSMEPMASDAIQKLLEDSKKLQKQSPSSDVYTATRALSATSGSGPPAALSADKGSTSTPTKTNRRDASKSSTPPLTVRLRAAIERRKTISSASSIAKEIQEARLIGPSVAVANGSTSTNTITNTAATTTTSTASSNDCVSESCSEGEPEASKPSDIVSSDLVPSSSTSSTTTSQPSQSTAQAASLSLSLNIASPGAPTKGEWACSICSCLNAKTRRMCKGCKASRIAAKTSVTQRQESKTPSKRPAPKSVSVSTPTSTPARRRALSLSTVTGTTTPSSSGSNKPPLSTRKPTAATPSGRTTSTTTRAAKRTRLSSDFDRSSNVETLSAETKQQLAPTTPLPAAKRQKTTTTPASSSSSSVKAIAASSSVKKIVPQRAVIGITGVDSETRGVIECAVHGIDANMASEPGHRKARVVKSVDYAAGVTHLIVGRDTKRTIKVLFAIARGAWILSEPWVFTSLEQEKWLPEHEYELASVFPARHLRQEPEQRQVFRGLKFFVGAKIDPSREVLISLLQCAGGEIANQISAADFCICGDETLFRRAARTKIKGVTPKWVFDSIAHLRLEDHAKYDAASLERKDDAE